jgi:hypothetical protein
VDEFNHVDRVRPAARGAADQLLDAPLYEIGVAAPTARWRLAIGLESGLEVT